MADDKIIQEVELKGAEQVQKDFKATGASGEQAFDRMGKAAEKTNFDVVVENLKSVAQSLQALQGHIDNTARSLQGLGSGQNENLNSIKSNADSASTSLENLNKTTEATAKTTDDAGKNVNTFASNLQSAIIKVGAFVIALAGVKLSFDSIKTSLKEVQDLGKVADVAGVDRGEFQKLQFIFESLGLSTDAAREKIKEFNEETDITRKNVGLLSGGAQQLITSTKQLGVSFSNSAGGMNAFRQQLAQTAQSAAGGQIDIDKLSDLIKKFQDETDPQKLVEYANQLSVLAQQGKSVATVIGTLPQGGFGKVINIPQIREGVKEVINLKQAWAAFLKDVDANNFARVVNFLQEITDEEKRTEAAAELLGDEMGNNLVRKLGELAKAGKGGVNPIKELSEDFVKLRLESAKNAQILSENFNRAMVRLSAAARAGREELALLFAPALTRGIDLFVTALRDSKGAISDLIDFIGSTASGVIEGFIELFSGSSSGGKKTTADDRARWLDSAKKATIEFGTAVSNIFNNVVMPIIRTVGTAFTELAKVVGSALGLDVNPSEVGIVAVLTFLLGPINAVALAFAALFGQSEKGLEKIDAFFAKLGIDFGQFRKDLVAIKDEFVRAFKGETVDTEWINELVAALKGLPGAVLVVVGAFLAFRRALVPIATALSALFVGKGGKPISADALLLGAVVGQMTGAFSILQGTLALVATAFATIGAGLFAFSRALTVAGQLIRGLAFVLGGARLAAFGFAGAALLIITNWEKVKELLKSVGIDIDGIIKHLDDAIEKDIGVRPLQLLGKAFGDAIKQMEKSFEEFKQTLEKEGLLSAAIDLIFKQDLPKLAAGLKQFVADIKKFGFVGALQAEFKRELDQLAKDFDEFFKVGGTLDQIVFKWITGVDLDVAWAAVVATFDKAVAVMKSKLDDFLAKVRDAVNFFRGLVGLEPLKDPVDPNARQQVDDLRKSVDEYLKTLNKADEAGDAGASELADGFGDADDAVDELKTNLTSMTNEFSSQSKKILSQIDQVSARIQGSTLGLGKGDSGWLTEQFGDPKAFTEQLGTGFGKVSNSVRTTANELNALVRGTKPVVDLSGKFLNQIQGSAVAADALANSTKPAVDLSGKFINQIKDGMTAAGMTVSQLNEMIKPVIVSSGQLADKLSQVPAAVEKSKPVVEKINDSIQKTPETVKKIGDEFGAVTTKIQDTLKTTNDQLKDFANVDDDDTKALLETWKSIAAEVLKALEAAKLLAQQQAAQPQPTTGAQGSAQPLLGQPQGRGLNDFLPNAPSSPNIEDRRGETFDPSATVEAARQAIEQIKEMVSAAQQEIASVAKAGFGAIQQSFETVGEGVLFSVDAIKQALETINTSIVTVVNSLSNFPAVVQQAFAVDPITAFDSAINSMAANVSAQIDALITKFNQLAQAARDAAAAAASASGGGGGTTQEGGGSGFAGGGRIHGRPGIDTNLIRATAGEFMMRVRAVRKYGLGFMRAVNSGRFELPGFDVGGLIGSMQNGMSTGSRVSVSMGSVSSSQGWEFIELGVPGFGIVPVVMKSTTARDVRDAAVRNRQTAISQTTR